MICLPTGSWLSKIFIIFLSGWLSTQTRFFGGIFITIIECSESQNIEIEMKNISKTQNYEHVHHDVHSVQTKAKQKQTFDYWLVVGWLFGPEETSLKRYLVVEILSSLLAENYIKRRCITCIFMIILLFLSLNINELCIKSQGKNYLHLNIPIF